MPKLKIKVEFDTPRAMSVLANKVKSEPDYAWTWYDKVASAAHIEGVSIETAKLIAARFMIDRFGIDASTLCEHKLCIEEKGDPATY